LNEFISDSQQPFALVFDFFRFARGTTLIEIAVDVCVLYSIVKAL
jgi:hypothetical protein